MTKTKPEIAETLNTETEVRNASDMTKTAHGYLSVKTGQPGTCHLKTGPNSDSKGNMVIQAKLLCQGVHRKSS